MTGFVMSASGADGLQRPVREWDPRGAFLISSRSRDGRLGVLVSVAYSRRGLFEEGFSSVRWDGGNSVGGFCSPVGTVPLNPTGGGANCGGNSNIPGFPAPPRLPNTPTNHAEYTEAALRRPTSIRACRATAG